MLHFIVFTGGILLALQLGRWIGSHEERRRGARYAAILERQTTELQIALTDAERRSESWRESSTAWRKQFFEAQAEYTKVIHEHLQRLARPISLEGERVADPPTTREADRRYVEERRQREEREERRHMVGTNGMPTPKLHTPEVADDEE